MVIFPLKITSDVYLIIFSFLLFNAIASLRRSRHHSHRRWRTFQTRLFRVVVVVVVFVNDI